VSVEIDPKKTCVDLGIVISDWEASRTFYCDTLGFEHVMDMPFPLGDGGTMHRVQAGDVTLKLTRHNTVPTAKNPLGGATTAVGIRYFTFWVRNLDDIVTRCAAAGYTIPIPVTEVRPGTRIAMVEDPDGNWVEFLQMN
jgi:glyoxylase I family protein